MNHAVYINYLEYARARYLQDAGYDYTGLLKAGFFTYISRVDVTYRSPALSDEELTIESEPALLRRVSGVMRQVIRRGDTVIAEANVHWCIVNEQGRPARPPDVYDLRSLTP